MKKYPLFVSATALTLLSIAECGFAAECKQLDPSNNLLSDCRTLSHLGDTACLVPEEFTIRAVERMQNSEDAWVTLNSNGNKKVTLKKINSGSGGGSANCRQAINFDKAKIQISGGGGTYQATIYNVEDFSSGTSVFKNVSLKLRAQPDAKGNDLWLEDADANMHYYIFLRDGVIGKVLPKFFYVEALDENDRHTGPQACIDDAPKLSKTVVAGACPSVKILDAGDSGGRLVETGVGGGGEGTH